jgi:hypothetical protein
MLGEKIPDVCPVCGKEIEMNKIKVIIKKPAEPYRYAEIENTLEAFQAIVGGYIECMGFGDDVLVCNEEGELIGLPENFRLRGDIIVGTVIVCGSDGEEFCDVSDHAECLFEVAP